MFEVHLDYAFLHVIDMPYKMFLVQVHVLITDRWFSGTHITVRFHSCLLSANVWSTFYWCYSVSGNIKLVADHYSISLIENEEQKMPIPGIEPKLLTKIPNALPIKVPYRQPVDTFHFPPFVGPCSFILTSIKHQHFLIVNTHLL